jgi:hypothetical protein
VLSDVLVQQVLRVLCSGAQCPNSRTARGDEQCLQSGRPSLFCKQAPCSDVDKQAPLRIAISARRQRAPSLTISLPLRAGNHVQPTACVRGCIRERAQHRPISKIAAPLEYWLECYAETKACCPGNARERANSCLDQPHLLEISFMKICS